MTFEHTKPQPRNKNLTEVSINMRRLLVICLSALLVSVASPAANPRIVSIYQLIANPEKFDKQLLTVIGLLAVQSEGILLFPSSEDAQHDVLPNAIWLEAKPEARSNLRELDRHYILLVGRFNAPVPNAAHPVYAGQIREISKATIWEASLTSPR
jgi:hypothetical protein